MIKYILSILFLISMVGFSEARNTHGRLSEGADTQAYFGEMSLHGYVTKGCLHATSANTTVTIPTCAGYTIQAEPRQKKYFEEPLSVTFDMTAGDNITWVAAYHTNNGTAPSGWTRADQTHIIYRTSDLRPELPDEATMLSRSVVTGGVVTKVYDVRNSNPFTGAIVATAPLYGVKADGVTDDSEALERVCTAARNRWFGYRNSADAANGQSQEIYFPPGTTYYIDNEWTCKLTSDPDDNVQIIITAHGATFRWGNMTPTATMINFSPDTACNDTAGENLWGVPFLRKVYWHGGFFQGPVHLDRYGIMMKAYGIRGFGIYDTTASNFHIMLNACVQNSFFVERNIWTTFTYAINIDDAEVDETSAISESSGQSSTHTLIQGNTLSGGIVNAGNQCHTILNFTSLAWQALKIQNNSFQGRCTNAWIDLMTGESDTRDTQVFTLANNTFEQAGSELEASTYGIRIRLREGASKHHINPIIENNELRFGSTAAFHVIQLEGAIGGRITNNFIEGGGQSQNWIGISITDSKNITVDNITFERGSQEPGEIGTCILLGGTLNDNIKLGDFNCSGLTIAVDSSAYSIEQRNTWTIGDGIRYLNIGVNKRWTDQIGEPAGYNGAAAQALAAGSATIDMDHASNLGPNFGGTYNGVVPRGYLMRVQIRDIDSDPGASPGALPNPGIWLARSEQMLIDAVLTDTPLSDRFMCSTAGMTDNAWVSCDGYVMADENGDIYAEWLASGTDALTIRLVVLAIYE